MYVNGFLYFGANEQNMKPKNNIWIVAFVLLSILNLLAEYLGSKNLIYATKPFLMVVLSIYFYLETKISTRYFQYVFIAFIFSFFGDTFLMFVENEPDKAHFFLLGLGSFLFTHLFYLIAFLSIPLAKTKGFLIQKKLLILPFIIYLIGNLLFLLPDINTDLQIPVIVYSSMIIAMTMAALNLKNILSKSIFQTLFIGVVLFVISDSIIGINKFKSATMTIPYPRLMIMIPYLLSQYLIARASILYYKG